MKNLNECRAEAKKVLRRVDAAQAVIWRNTSGNYGFNFDLSAKVGDIREDDGAEAVEVVRVRVSCEYEQADKSIVYYLLHEHKEGETKVFKSFLKAAFGSECWGEITTLDKPFSEVNQDDFIRLAILNDWTRWNKSLKFGDCCEISEHVYNSMLEAVPPVNWVGSYFECGEPHHHRNGKAIRRAFWKVDNRFFTGYPNN
jgi:hypothetical protein